MKNLLTILVLTVTIICIGCGDLPNSPSEAAVTLDSHWFDTWFEYAPAHPVADEITFIKYPADSWNMIFISAKYVSPYEIFRGNYVILEQTMTSNKMDSYLKVRFDDILGGSWVLEMRTANWNANLANVTIGKSGYAETKLFRRGHEI